MSAAATSPYRCNARPTWVVHYRQRLEPVIRRLGRRDARVQYRTECIHHDATERKLLVSAQRLADMQVLLDQHRELLRHVQDRSFAFECELQRAKRGGGSPTALDDQTKALVRLATSNPNEHEKHAAAMLVCKRLREKLDA